jgi:uncharacterized protein (DUF1800 family)
MVRNRWFSTVLLLALVAPVGAQQIPARERDAIHLLQRATFGVRPADVTELLRMGRDQWLDRQLNPGRIPDQTAVAKLDAFPILEKDMSEQLAAYQRQQMEQRQRQQAIGGMDNLSEERRQALQDSIRRARVQSMTPEQRQEQQMYNAQNVMTQLVSAKLTRAVYSDRQLEEMMTDFWFNHFNVFFGKGIDRYLISDYEAKAIRPNVFGKFRDLLGATARHPAMLFYLDNAQSVAVDSTNPGAVRQRQQLAQFQRMTPAQQEDFLRRRNLTRAQVEQRMLNPNAPAPNRQRGLNENYARELMELHTLGVDGGYTQKDVIEVARAFTGWQFTRGDDVAFVFRPQMHDRGTKTVLGKSLPANRGIEDGEQVLDLLAAHPSTAKFIATKLVERFVNDQPPAELVNELTVVFQKTNGDLRAVTKALFSSPRFYDEKNYRAKVKTPFELVASAFRVTGADVGLSRATVQTLRSLGHLPYNEPAPTGFPAASEDWVNSGAMLNRMNFGLALAANRLDGVRLTPGALNAGPQAATVEAWVPGLLARLIPGTATARLQTTILNELKKPVDATAAAPAAPMQDNAMRRQARQNGRNAQPGAGAPVRESAARALGLALGSPDFQRK